MSGVAAAALAGHGPGSIPDRLAVGSLMQPLPRGFGHAAVHASLWQQRTTRLAGGQDRAPVAGSPGPLREHPRPAGGPEPHAPCDGLRRRMVRGASATTTEQSCGCRARWSRSPAAFPTGRRSVASCNLHHAASVMLRSTLSCGSNARPGLAGGRDRAPVAGSPGPLGEHPRPAGGPEPHAPCDGLRRRMVRGAPATTTGPTVATGSRSSGRACWHGPPHPRRTRDMPLGGRPAGRRRHAGPAPRDKNARPARRQGRIVRRSMSSPARSRILEGRATGLSGGRSSGRRRHHGPCLPALRMRDLRGQIALQGTSSATVPGILEARATDTQAGAPTEVGGTTVPASSAATTHDWPEGRHRTRAGG